MFEHLPLVLAQTSIEPTTGLYELLLKNGVLGGAVAVLAFFLIRRDGDLQKCQEGRLTDAKLFAEIVKDHTAAMATSNSVEENRNRALEVAARAAEKSAIVIDQMTKEISDLKGELKEVKRN